HLLPISLLRPFPTRRSSDLTPPPFDHSKLMIVDGHWVLLGSANWDARSLRLNFELNVEAYGRHFAEEMSKIVQDKLRGARKVTLDRKSTRLNSSHDQISYAV